MPSSASTVPEPFAPARLGPLTLRNRTIKAATFEGRTPSGLVTEELINFHRTFAAGGIGMTTLAFCAVTADGRQFAPMIRLDDPQTQAGLRDFTDAVHDEGAAASIQIGHAGVVSNAASTGLKAIGPSRRFDLQNMRNCRAATVPDLDRIVLAFARGVTAAVDAGFDAVEVHLGHDYLPSSFLNPKLNRRDDDYGGSLENRARLARRILATVREHAGDRVAVIAKLTMDDGVPGGIWIDEAIAVARMIESDETAHAIELTMGSSPNNTMYMFRGAPPIREFAAALPQPRRALTRLGGRIKLRTYPYEPLFMLETARQIRSSVRLPLILLGGISEYTHITTAMKQGFEFVALGRALLREPDLIRRLSVDHAHQSLCIHCNRCMPTIFAGGTHCALRP